MIETLPMNRTTAVDASIGPTTCPDLVATLEAPKAPSSSPTLEGETTLKTFLLMQRRWLTAVAATPTYLHPAIFIS
jgi:hypothetical protein